MLNVFIYKDKRGSFTKFEACGHANFNERGKDIACAGASALLQTCALGLKKQKINAKILLKNGCLLWNLKKNNSIEKKEIVKLLVDTMLIGLKEIQKKYPKNIKISIRRD